MLIDFNNFKLEYKIDQYFNGTITLEQLNIDYEISILKEGWTDTFTEKLKSMLDKCIEWSNRVATKGKSLLEKIFNFLWTIIKAIGRWCDKHKNLCVFILLMVIMITVGSVSSYAAVNPNDPNLPEIANAAIGYLEKISTHLIQDGVSERNIEIAKSILTDIRQGGSNIDYSQISKEADALAKSAMKISEEMAKDDPNSFSKLTEIGSHISSKFTYTINGLKTIIGA
jgi:hypothetical protein